MAEYIRKSNTSKEEYPQNLLDAIACEWEEQLPDDFSQTLAYVLAGLTEREQAIIEMRFKRGFTYEQAGREFNVTRERIRQIETKALRKLRCPSRLYLIKRGVRRWVADAREEGRRETISEELRQAIDGVLKIADALKIDLNAAAKIETENLADIPIEDLCLSVRSYNVLYRAGYKTLSDVCKLSFNELLKLRNIGRKSAMEILEALEERGLELRGGMNQNG